MRSAALVARGVAAGLLVLLTACTGGEDAADPAEEQSGSGSVGDVQDDAPANLEQSDSENGAQAEVESAVHPDEWGEVMAACMNELGIPAEVTRDGGVSTDGVSAQQAPLIEDASRECEARFPLQERYTRPLTDEQIAFIYRYLVEEAVPCIEARGYETPEPPSEEVFLDTYGSSEVLWWQPFPEIAGEEWYDLLEACPQSPPVDELYPEE